MDTVYTRSNFFVTTSRAKTHLPAHSTNNEETLPKTSQSSDEGCYQRGPELPSHEQSNEDLDLGKY